MWLVAINLNNADIRRFHHHRRFLWISGLESKKEQGEGDSEQLKNTCIYNCGRSRKSAMCCRMGDLTSLTFKRI